jgi:hypothetical protein
VPQPRRINRMKDKTKVTRSARQRRNRLNAWRPDQESCSRPHLRLVPPWREADMGIRLVMEASGSRVPESLTWRERYALMVLAASAIDATRELQPGVIEDSPDLAARLKMSRSQLYVVLDALCEKGALLRLERGRNGVKAVYAIAPFGTTAGPERPGEPDVPPVENPLKDPSKRDAKAPAKDPGSGNEGSRFTPSKDPGFRDSAPYIGIRGVKTGGGTPSAPRQSPLLMPVPDGQPRGEGESNRDQTRNRDRQALAAEIVAVRPEWTTRSVLRALEHLDVAERPWPIVAEAMRIVAADKATTSPGRLRHAGPWWAEAARRVRDSTEAPSGAGGAHAFDPDPESRLCQVCHAPEVDKNHTQRKSA